MSSERYIRIYDRLLMYNLGRMLLIYLFKTSKSHPQANVTVSKEHKILSGGL